MELSLIPVSGVRGSLFDFCYTVSVKSAYEPSGLSGYSW